MKYNFTSELIPKRHGYNQAVTCGFGTIDNDYSIEIEVYCINENGERILDIAPFFIKKNSTPEETAIMDAQLPDANKTTSENVADLVKFYALKTLKSEFNL